MPPFGDPLRWNERPAVRGLVLAFAAAAAQTPIAAWAWVSCFALGLAASRWPQRGDAASAAAEPDRPAARPEPVRPLNTPRLVVARPGVRREGVATPGGAPPLTLDELRERSADWTASLHAEGLSVCVLHGSLQGFDTLAERYGDEAARQVRLQLDKRLRHVARADDRLVRLDDDRFALLVSCPPNDAPILVRQLAARLVHELQRPVAWRTLSNLQVGCSVGSAVWRCEQAALDDAMAQADMALAQARRSGRGQTRLYSPFLAAVPA